MPYILAYHGGGCGLSPGLFYGQQWKQDKISVMESEQVFCVFLLPNIHLGCFDTLPFVKCYPVRLCQNFVHHAVLLNGVSLKAPPWHLLSSFFPFISIVRGAGTPV